MTAIEKALQILDILIENEAVARPADLMRATGFPAGTLHRMLNTLAKSGYVQKNEVTGDYALGMKFLKAYQSLLRDPDLIAKAHPHLKELSRKLGLTSSLGCLQADKVLYLDSNPVQEGGPLTYWPAGTVAALHATSLGKVLLAHLPEIELASLLQRQPLTMRTPNTLTTASRLMNELEQVRQSGFAVDDEEHDLGWRCIGAPVFDHRAQVIAAISVSAPAQKLTPEQIQRVAQHVKTQAQAISKSLGHDAGPGRP